MSDFKKTIAFLESMNYYKAVKADGKSLGLNEYMFQGWGDNGQKIIVGPGTDGFSSGSGFCEFLFNQHGESRGHCVKAKS